jgi:SNF2 family DNA or RNA helicase
VLTGGWAFQFLDRMREASVTVSGWEGLKTLRINPHRPETKVLLSSGTDWFDAHVEIHFGEQRATVADVKRALAAKQHYVTLTDGSLGMLPEDWLQKYALLLKVGESRGDKLRLKKFHFGVLDQLLTEVREDDVQRELEEKRERLAAVLDKDFSDAHPPEGLTASLRPYQLSGYQWLLFLKEAGWGGILADDMGLGKTVQALALFQHFKNEDVGARFLVVCPTTLLYNWENEVRKFTPGLKALIHHGPKRATGMRGLGDADVIISTYGTVRSDVKWLREYRWACAVLDESQAIKNPQSQSAKAAQLLQAEYRLALSGTPVQNNTFDLYSQMHYLNPGLLGSREKFASEFATPIDKFGEADIKEQLRRLIHPFILRRTKEAVAKDLPAKTEMTLWCEMGPEQRRIYESYRVAYRDSLLGLIDQQGIDKSQFHILQGLTQLRQICDAPGLVGEISSANSLFNGDEAADEDRLDGETTEVKVNNEAEEEIAAPALAEVRAKSKERGAHSVKLDEVVREIEENVGEHKALVFSQFLGMLALIRKALEKEGIPYAYFDGSSTTKEREAAVSRFQEDPECRVFLISLKAGGVGLNLTAADYVYIVDPWWNPAVEQQAIDRTHRIGQTKAVFAYRMICRDSIEEKMLLLQERKRTLAADLVMADDGAFLKRLSREDVAFLLS